MPLRRVVLQQMAVYGDDVVIQASYWIDRPDIIL